MSRAVSTDGCRESVICDFCGREKGDPSLMFQSVWTDRLRDFCDLECFHGFRAAIALNDDLVYDGPPGTAKRLLDQSIADQEGQTTKEKYT